MGYEVFMKERNEEVVDKELTTDKHPMFRKIINMTFLMLGILLIIFFVVGKMLIPISSFSQNSFDFYETETYEYYMFEDHINYVFVLNVENQIYFDLYDKESGNITHDIITLALGETYDNQTNLQRYMYENGYSTVSDFFIKDAYTIAIVAGIACILFSIINQHIAFRSKMAKNDPMRTANKITRSVRRFGGWGR